MMDLWHKKMAEAFMVRRDQLVNRIIGPVKLEFVSPLQAVMEAASPVLVENMTQAYGRSPAMEAIDIYRNLAVDISDPNHPIREPWDDFDASCDECGCDPCECDENDEPPYEFE